MTNKSIYRAYDIRGNTTTDLSVEIAYKIGYVFTKLTINATNKVIVVGMDGRLSSPALCNGLISGLKNGGAEVVFIGLCSTPMLYFADYKFKPAASVMITGSHNPKEDNGFKILQNNRPFFGEMIQELKRVIEGQKWSDIKIDNYLETIKISDVSNDYVAAIINDSKFNRKLKVAIDTSNGAASEITKKLSQELPLDFIIFNDKIDGNFPAHNPDPMVAENLTQLQKMVLEEQCDLGVCFDGDGDRIGVVTNSARIIYGDQLLCIYAKQVLKHIQGATIIADVKASDIFCSYVTKLGGKPLIWKTGHSYIKAKMQEIKAPLAGEMSGHVFFADRYFGFDDGLYAAMRLLEILANSDSSLDEMIGALPQMYNTPEIRIKVAEDKKFSLIKQIKQDMLRQGITFNDIDGLRVEEKNGWWLLRSSNTEAAISIRIEATTKTGLEKLQNRLQKLLANYNVYMI
ncbi:MAG: phosphomannomutase/phosphoglucomutase [Rickettsiaceae bacterium]|nr:phosphomannomutase/phosphoglucomutase [Rickettsiaceae bacterium]